MNRLTEPAAFLETLCRKTQGPRERRRYSSWRREAATVSFPSLPAAPAQFLR